MATTRFPSRPGAADARETALPAAPRRRRRWDPWRVLAQALCFALALVGTLPFVATVVVRSAWARSWAAARSEELLRQQGIVAKYAPSLRVWPLAVELA